MGHGSPHANLFIRANGGRFDVTRRSPVTNSFESANMILNPSFEWGVKRIYELELTNSGAARFYVNGQLHGENTHVYPEFLVQNIGAGQNPGNGNGVDGKFYRIISIIEGGDNYEQKIDTIRSALFETYNITP